MLNLTPKVGCFVRLGVSFKSAVSLRRNTMLKLTPKVDCFEIQLILLPKPTSIYYGAWPRFTMGPGLKLLWGLASIYYGAWPISKTAKLKLLS